MNSILPSSPRIVFHVVDDKRCPTKFLDIKFDFCISKKIDLNKTFFISDKYFTKRKDRFKTNMSLTTDQKKIKFIITIYYGENHITIFKSNNIGICYEIIQMFFNSLGNPLDKIAFAHGNNKEIFVTHYDSIENNLTSSFHKIDEELKFYDSEHTGTTATILLFQDNIVYCANVGDSTAFIIYDNFIKKISIDHKCTDPKEEERILLNGGKITKNRVMGQLVLSRCLGDLYCKKYGVSNIPDISVNKLEGNVKYVVVASDGVWDVVKENELLQLSKNRKNAEGFCKDLVKLAIDKDTKDNVSCIVISFDS